MDPKFRADHRDEFMQYIFLFGVATNVLILLYYNRIKKMQRAARIDALVEEEKAKTKKTFMQEIEYNKPGNVEIPGKGLIFIDNKTVLQNDLKMEDVEAMFDQPEKFFLSNYLRNKVIKRRNQQLVENASR